MRIAGWVAAAVLCCVLQCIRGFTLDNSVRWIHRKRAPQSPTRSVFRRPQLLRVAAAETSSSTAKNNGDAATNVEAHSELAPLVEPIIPVAPTRMNPRHTQHLSLMDWMEPCPTEFEYAWLPNHRIYPRGKFKDVIWLQNPEEVQVAMPLPLDFKRYHDVKVNITQTSLTATLRGDLIFQCSLCGRVAVEKSMWTVDNHLSTTKRRWLVYTLVKLIPFRTWEYVFGPLPGVSDVQQMRLTPEEHEEGRRLTPFSELITQ